MEVRSCQLRAGSRRSKSLAKQKHVGKECTEMYGRIQVVDQLGADLRLIEYEFHSGKRITRVAVQHGQKSREPVSSFEFFLPYRSRTTLRESDECFERAIQEFPALPA